MWIIIFKKNINVENLKKIYKKYKIKYNIKNIK